MPRLLPGFDRVITVAFLAVAVATNWDVITTRVDAIKGSLIGRAPLAAGFDPAGFREAWRDIANDLRGPYSP